MIRIGSLYEGNGKRKARYDTVNIPCPRCGKDRRVKMPSFETKSRQRAIHKMQTSVCFSCHHSGIAFKPVQPSIWTESETS